MEDETSATTELGLGQALLRNKLVQLGELAVVFIAAAIVVVGARGFVGEDPLARQGVAWVANVVMLVLIWVGLRLRGQGPGHLGLMFRLPGWRRALHRTLQSVVVFVVAVAAFVLGAIAMANIAGAPQAADTSGYNYLSGNLGMLILALAAVYIVSSFGEEVIYRGFLINRIGELGSGGQAARWVAVAISSVAFGLVHFEWGLAGMVQTGFMGVALGAAYLMVGHNLWVTVLAHGYMDTILLVQLYLSPGQGVAA